MSSISGSLTLLHVDDVEGTVRFLEDAFGLQGVGSCGGEGDAEHADDGHRFEMLENQSGSVQVVVLPKSAHVLGGAGGGGCATLTLATDSVRRTAATAVRAGARLLRSHRVPLPMRTETKQTAVGGGGDGGGGGPAAVEKAAVDGATDGSARVEDAQEEDPDAAGSSNFALEDDADGDGDAADLESGLALLGAPPVVDVDAANGNGDGEGGFAVRVLLVDERLLARRRSPALAPSLSENNKNNDEAAAVAAAAAAAAAAAEVADAAAAAAAAGAVGTGVSGEGEDHEAAITERGVGVNDTGVGRVSGLKDGRGGTADAKGESSSSRSSSGQTASDKDGHTTCPEESASSSGSTSGSARCGGGGGATWTSPLLLTGLASLAESSPREIFYSCSSGLGGDASSSCASVSGDSPQTPHAGTEGPSEIPENRQLPFRAAGEASGGDVGVGVGVSPSRATRRLGSRHGGESGRDNAGSWFSQEDLLGGRVGGGGGGGGGDAGGGDGSGGGGGGDEALPGASSTSNGDSNSNSNSNNGSPASGPAGGSEAEDGKKKKKEDMVVGGGAADDGHSDDGHSVTTVAASTNGSSAAEQSRSASASGAGDHGDAGGAEQASGTQEADGGGKPTLSARPQRPFRQLETFMLGNDGGPLKTSPNSIAPIPIDNQHFEGLALLMLKREPMDKRYARMFEGKNRMFEVQVQGKFKKPPDGELFISLEITDRMKLGLLTKGLCKLLLSFGQKLNRRLHYSFGDKDNAELPHIAFPLVSSVDSLICTPEGGEVPVLGRPFEEGKERKASRRRGEEDNAAGIGEFQTSYTYSFSFHSMYIDMAQWSTCKIPVMRDIDLHTFWGSSALRVAAYVIKSKSPKSSWEASTPHLQSRLEYVFCVQVRHLPQSELGDAGSEEEEEEGDWDEGDGRGDMNASETPPGAATIPLPAEAEATETKRPAITAEEPQDLEREDELATAEIGDVIALPLLTDREPSPRGRQMSASRWASNDDASDDEQDDRQARRERRRRRRRRRRKATPGSAAEGAATETVVGGAGDGQGRGGSDGDIGAGDSEDEESQSSSSSESVERNSGEVAAATAGETGNNQSQDATAAAAAAAAAAAVAAAGYIAEDAVRPSELVRATTGGPHTAWRENSADAASSQQQEGSAAGKLNATIASPERGGGGRPVLRRGGTGVGADGGVGDDVEDAMVRCPAYVDLYARSPKLQGTWTVFVVVKRGGTGRGKGGGEFALRSSKNLSILPASVVPKKVHYSPRLSRQEVKRRKLDTVLQLLTASSHAHAHRSYQVIIRAVLGMESSADRAYRHYSPAPTSAPSTSASASRGQATSASKSPSTTGSRRGSRSDSGRNYPDGGGGGTSSSLRPGFLEEEEYEEVGTFSAGISVDRALSSATAGVAAAEGGGSFHGDGQGGEEGEVEGEGEDESFAFWPRPSLASLASNRSGGSELSSATAGSTGRRRSWASRSASLVKEGMVLRVLSEHHLSQQVAVLLPSSLTFSRPRKQCLRLLTRDIMSVELGGGAAAEDGVWSSSPESQLIPGMYLVEIHTVGRVHYILVEGIHEARSWASAIRDTYLQRARSDGKSSPAQSKEDLSISDPFSQYMTKKSAWRASNFWVLNCRRALELGGSAAGAEGWGGGCWMDEGGLGGQVCDFVAGLLRQALELNDDSKPEQLIAFLDDICGLRWMPLEGLSQSEQLAVFLNLYHVMLLHAFFILGPPGSPLRVASYFTTLCYEVGGDVLSMADLEHCVLRAKTSQPKQFLSKLIIPTTEYPFSLRQPEPRVSFALNCGSVSGVPGILVYRPESVYEQLDDASTYYIQNTSEVLVGKRTVILPKIVSWYSDDFNGKAEEPSGSMSSSSLACLLQVKRYFTGERRRQIEGLLADGGSVSVKFESWNWKCRPVTLVSEPELATLRADGEA